MSELKLEHTLTHRKRIKVTAPEQSKLFPVGAVVRYQVLGDTRIGEELGYIMELRARNAVLGVIRLNERSKQYEVRARLVPWDFLDLERLEGEGVDGLLRQYFSTAKIFLTSLTDGDHDNLFESPLRALSLAEAVEVFMTLLPLGAADGLVNGNLAQRREIYSCEGARYVHGRDDTSKPERQRFQRAFGILCDVHGEIMFLHAVLSDQQKETSHNRAKSISLPAVLLLVCERLRLLLAACDHLSRNEPLQTLTRLFLDRALYWDASPPACHFWLYEAMGELNNGYCELAEEIVFVSLTERSSNLFRDDLRRLVKAMSHWTRQALPERLVTHIVEIWITSGAHTQDLRSDLSWEATPLSQEREQMIAHLLSNAQSAGAEELVTCLAIHGDFMRYTSAPQRDAFAQAVLARLSPDPLGRKLASELRKSAGEMELAIDAELDALLT